MKFLLTTLFFLLFIFFSSCSCIRFENKGSAIFDVTSFSAVGDGKTDDSQAFLKAWEAVCGAAQGNPTLYVPPAKTFMLKPLRFEGPCKSNSVSVRLQGTLVAPGYAWSNPEPDAWIAFSDITGLIINGGGAIDGQGSFWWKSCNSLASIDSDPNASSGCLNRPTALHFHQCDGLQLSGIHHFNSPSNHISIHECNRANIFDLKIHAPEDSPNTDGIRISGSTKINIQDSEIATGDDCIAIIRGSSFVNITRVTCGPGHGISVGSLGSKPGIYDTVEEIYVKNCTLIGTDNGVRIKTYKNGKGYARKITFEKIQLIESKNPIIINQDYVNNMFGSSDGGVKVSDITYNEVQGTSKNEAAITLNCNENLGCNNIMMDGVNITAAKPGMKLYSICSNAQGKASSVSSPAIDCLAKRVF